MSMRRPCGNRPLWLVDAMARLNVHQLCGVEEGEMPAVERDNTAIPHGHVRCLCEQC